MPDVTRRRVTLADVARHAGVSTAVVSYVINNGPRPVSEALRTRVRAAVSELDYRPDHVARAMRRPPRWGQIGLLVPDLSLPLYGQLARHVETAARHHDLLVITANSGFDGDVEREFTGAFVEAGVRGLVVVGGADATATARVCARDRTPVVFMHSNGAPGTAELIRSDHLADGALATGHLVGEHGRRGVEFVGGITGAEVARGDHETVRARFAGYRSVVGEAAAVRLSTDLSGPGTYAAVRERLRRPDPPGGLVVGTRSQADAVLRAVFDSGLGVPDDVALAGFDGDPRHSPAPWVLTAVHQRLDALAGTAVARLLGDPAPGAGPDVPRGRLRPGDTCGCPASGPVPPAVSASRSAGPIG